MSTVELFCPKCEWRWAPPPVVGLPGFVSLDEPCPHCGNGDTVARLPGSWCCDTRHAGVCEILVLGDVDDEKKGTSGT